MLKLILAVGGNGDNRKAGAGAGAGTDKIVIRPIGHMGPIVGLIRNYLLLPLLLPILLTNRIACAMIRTPQLF